MKTILAAIAALTLTAGTAFGQTIPLMQVFEFHIDVDLQHPSTNQTAQLQSIQNGPVQNLIQFNTDTGETTVQYSGQVRESGISGFDQGAIFDVQGAGNFQPDGQGGFIANLDLTSSIGGNFQLPLAGTINPLNFNLAGGPVTAPNTPAGPILITGHRLTPEPGSLVLLGLGAAAVMGTRRRKAA